LDCRRRFFVDELVVAFVNLIVEFGVFQANSDDPKFGWPLPSKLLALANIPMALLIGKSSPKVAERADATSRWRRTGKNTTRFRCV